MKLASLFIRILASALWCFGFLTKDPKSCMRSPPTKKRAVPHFLTVVRPTLSHFIFRGNTRKQAEPICLPPMPFFVRDKGRKRKPATMISEIRQRPTDSITYKITRIRPNNAVSAHKLPGFNAEFFLTERSSRQNFQHGDCSRSPSYTTSILLGDCSRPPFALTISRSAKLSDYPTNNDLSLRSFTGISIGINNNNLPSSIKRILG
jgi:hypothetical protein